MSEFITYQCPDCHGEAVGWDAWSEWDPAAHKTVVRSEYDEGYCFDCDGEKRLVKVEITDPAREHALLGERWRLALAPLAPQMLVVLQETLGDLERAKSLSARPSTGVDGMMKRIRDQLADIQKAQLLATIADHEPIERLPTCQPAEIGL